MKPRILLGSFLERNSFLSRLLSKFEVEIINVEELELITRDEREKLADLILLDLSEKEEEGLEMLAKAKLNPEKIPVIVIGETRDENFGIECMRKGVQEFITKSHLTESILSTAIIHTIERHRFSQESKKKVQRTYDFLREVFNKIEDPVFVKDTKHQWILWNKSFREFLRLSEEEILKRSDIDFFSPEEVDVFWKNDDLVIKTGEVNTSEEVISFGEEQKIISTKKSRFIDRNGEKFLIGLIRDVTDYKRLIKQEEEARKEAERANKVKDNFLAIVSHELKNPLTAILCLTKYMQQAELDKEKTKELLKRVEKSAKTQERLINDLLDVSQIVHGGNLGIQSSRIDLKELIEEILVTLREKADEKSITIDSKLSKACLVGDPVRLQQIVTNLICNAVKFTPKGGKIKVRLSKTTKSEIKIEIRDTGVGIAPEFLPHVFEFFRRENGEGTKNVKGMGLGLGIVKNLVESHQGTITAESPGKGKGSTFKVSLPMAICPSENEGS